MKLTTFEDITRLCRRRFKWVCVPVGPRRWGLQYYAKVRIRSLTEEEMGLAELSIALGSGGIDTDRLLNARRLLVSWCVVNENGQQLFDTDEKAAALGRLDGKAVKVLWEACREHCGYADVDIEELVQFFEVVKGLGTKGPQQKKTAEDHSIDDLMTRWVANGEARKLMS